MALQEGRRLCQYEILSHIGAGGMGEVYLARDTKLDREVAIKVLPDSLARDKDRLLRFEREAKLLASLNHANIAVIHGFEDDDGTKFLVLEFVQGETLAQRLERGRLPIDEAIETARQIAEALEAAHEKGVIHRDLKPGNVMVRPDGTVKVLDFGLARAVTDDSGDGSPGHDSTTITADHTRPGLVLGTAGYLSPEQARGHAVDRRTDIFAFGCVLYQMLSGAGPFAGETLSDSIGSTLHLEPNWDALPADTPASVYVLLTRCLAKDCKRRLQAIGDARLELEEVASVEQLTGLLTNRQGKSSVLLGVLPWLLCGALAIVLAVSLGGEGGRSTSAVSGSERWEITLPADTSFGWSDMTDTWSKVGYSRLLAISRDGRRMIQAVRHGGRSTLVLKDGAAFTWREVAGTENARGPFFSPDGQWIGFIAGGVLKKVRMPGGGAPQPICAVNSTAFDATWLPGDVIIFSTDRGLYRVSASAGEAEQLTTLDIDAGERGHHFPHALPGNRLILFTLASNSDMLTAVLSLDDGSWKVVKQDAADARYDPRGYLVFARHGEVLAVAYDPANPLAVGTAVPIVQGVHTTPGHGGAVVHHFATSDTGRLVYAPRAMPSEEDTLVWVDREGGETPIVSGAGIWMHQRLSPKGDRIVFNKQTDDGMLDLYVYDLERGQTERLTRNGTSYDAEWDPDGKTVIFASLDTVGRAFYSIMPDFSGPPRKITAGVSDRRPHLCDWTHDGSSLVYFDRYSVGGIWLADPNGHDQPRELLNTELKERWARISDDGRLIAYVGGDELKSEPREIYVQRFPDLGHRVRVSVNGGGEPLWSPDSTTLYFREGGTVFAATIETDPVLEAGPPTPLFSGDYDNAPTGHSHYDISRDGQRFLMVKHGRRYRPRSVHVVENWVGRLGRDSMP